MPRKKMLKFGGRPRVRKNHYYELHVAEVVPHEKHASILFQHDSEEMEGAFHELKRKVPLNPAGIVGDLLRALGIEVNEGSSIDPDTLEDREVRARFARRKGQWEIVEFRPLEDTNHEPGTRDTHGVVREECPGEGTVGDGEAVR